MSSPDPKKKPIVNNGSYGVPKIEEEDGEPSAIAAGVGLATAIAAGVGLAAWGLSKVFGSAPETSDNRKMMKAPGMDHKIYRDDFESDPAKWFRDHRK